jgi:hypothetical protein
LTLRLLLHICIATNRRAQAALMHSLSQFEKEA